MELEEKFISRTEIYDGKILKLVKDKVLLPNGNEAEREMCLHIGAVAVLPLLSDGRVVMERQYRYPHGRIFLEIPAGKLDFPGEDPLSAAKRELREETGATAKSYTPLGVLDTTPALINEKISLFLAEDISFSEAELDDDEFINVELIPLNKLYSMVMSGEIRDAKTQIAILKVYMLRGNKCMPCQNI